MSLAEVGQPAPPFRGDETLRGLQGLQSGGLCPADWKPGKKTLKPGE
jgi:alkyl hydroperoxide reductase subunit AhpC